MAGTFGRDERHRDARVVLDIGDSDQGGRVHGSTSDRHVGMDGRTEEYQRHVSSIERIIMHTLHMYDFAAERDDSVVD